MDLPNNTVVALIKKNVDMFERLKVKVVENSQGMQKTFFCKIQTYPQNFYYSWRSLQSLKSTCFLIDQEFLLFTGPILIYLNNKYLALLQSADHLTLQQSRLTVTRAGQVKLFVDLDRPIQAWHRGLASQKVGCVQSNLKEKVNNLYLVTFLLRVWLLLWLFLRQEEKLFLKCEIKRLESSF